MPQFKNFLQACVSACPIALIALMASTAHADTPRQEFTTAQQKWQAAGIQNYSFTLFQGCFCPGGQPMRITVRYGEVQSATSLRDGTPVEAKTMGKPLTMAEILQKIEAAYARPADHITLTLNPEYGYPEQVYIDYVAMMADEELSYTISDFTH